MGSISIQYPTWYIILCLLLGLLYAGLLYWREGRFAEQRRWLPWLMFALRWLAVTGIALLLLSPLIKQVSEETKKPIVVVVQDASQSVAEDAALDQAKLQTDMQGLSQSLRQEYEVVNLRFGEAVAPEAVDSFSDQSTNISEVLAYVSDNFADQNLGAVVLASDGIYNEGRDPRYLNNRLKAPIYTIALGDTTKRRDVLVKNVFHNKIAYLGDKFTIQVDLQAFNAAGEQTTLTVRKMGEQGSNKLLHTSRHRIKSNDFFHTEDIILDADAVGVVRYRVSASPVGDEVSKSNNYKDIYVEVLDSRQKILLLANAPHPDLTALKQIISTNKNYTVDLAYAKKGVKNVQDYSLVVLHNLPSKTTDASAIIAQMDKRRVPRLYIVGSQTNAAAFTQQQNVIGIKQSSSSTEDVQAQLESGFSAYILDTDLLKRLSNYPPLTAPFGEYSTAGPAATVFTQRIKKIDTDYPQLAYVEQNGFKTGVFVGEGLWRWRLFNYMKDKNYDVVNEVISKAVQYVAVKEDRRRFRASVSKNIFKENESVFIDAQMYNASYELINESDVFVKVINSEGKEYNYTMSRSNGYYTIDAGLLAPGNYRFVATTSMDGKQEQQSGRFSVQEIQLEQYDLTARHDILAQLANNSGGQLVYPSGIAALGQDLTTTNKLKPVIYQSTKTTSIIHLKWLFGALLLLLGLEWFLRRYFGYY